jgi:hypothetical protein
MTQLQITKLLSASKVSGWREPPEKVWLSTVEGCAVSVLLRCLARRFRGLVALETLTADGEIGS